ncbi:serine-rich adhesin for platelets isoform X1 [Octopus bimaculoides]|uniref:ATR-interacting protein n=1 Tax=Octopus bimaculoides TaxID=37653 RepID=A0A0L8G2V8_OCTBM|nr:serine-rich adhesin for platelets isoform X1 [Octopus bimaculoides]XP_014784740.1 serine-rich adhesin for platelets isoform X1 [Octopus bimaculoides]XP_052827835.1 serine-rich adhesin for platelets isoform X1 [Octopus bimaculoides]|eukprot:XP_014784739.1 PREDICTED: serine-rich adhesin for platelets-like [Octopus bimaculoides]
MAEPPALPNQKRKFCYQRAQLDKSSTSKRRKDSDESKNDFEDDWDGELTLTQQELNELDNAASSAYTVKAGPSSVKPDQGQAPNVATKVVTPGVLPGSHTQFLFPKQDVAPYQPVSKLVQRSSSTSSSSSTFPVSSTTSYDSSNSSHSSASSSSLHRPKSDSSKGDKTTLDQKLIEELQLLRRESKKYKQNLYLKEGEIKILRTDLQKETEKLSKLQQDKTQQEVREKTESEKHLKSEIERLNVQLQFKEQEIMHLKDSLLNVKSSIAASGAASPQSATTSSYYAGSSKVRRVLVEKPSPQKKFPSDDSILSADNIRSRGNGKISISPQKSTSESVCSSTYSNRRKKILNVHLHHGKLTGSQLTSKLVQDTLSDKYTMSSCFNSGIIQLLQLHSTQDFAGLKFSRDSTSFLLKQKSKSMSDLRNIMDSRNKKDMVSSSNLNLAIHGLSQLLITDCSPTNQQEMSTSRSSDPSQNSLNLLLQLIPLLADYLGHYCDQLSTNLIASSTDLCDSLTSGNNGKSGSSSESSMDSVSSSVNMLLQDCANVANQLELLVIVTLRVLHKLIAFCTELRHSLLVNDTDKLANSLSNSLSMTSPNQKSSKTSVPSFLLQDIKKYDLLNKLFQLANPIPEKLCNPRIVKLAGSILILLAKSSTAGEVELFLPAVSSGIIKNCLVYEQCFEVQLAGLQLFLNLCHSQQIISQVCSNNNTDECLLSTIYNMSYQLLRDSAECKIPMQLYHTVIEILTTLCSQQPLGASCLVESQCPCNMECVKCCVHILYHILEQHQCHCKKAQSTKLDGREMICNNCMDSNKEKPNVKDCTCEYVLYEGALLLYTISQKEQNFFVRDVLHKYTILISHLQHLVEMNEESQWKIEVSALKELWEFVIDSDSLTEDEETAMETS